MISWKYALAAILLAGVAAAGAGFFAATRPGPVLQPIEFSHRKHVVENGMSCTDCHPTVESEIFSTLPDASTCALCHEQPQGKSGEEKKLAALLRTGRPLEWRPLFRQPGHVFYSHRRHVVNAGLACEACHGSIAQSTSPPRRVQPLSMDDCIQCHRQRGVAVACTTCHR